MNLKLGKYRISFKFNPMPTPSLEPKILYQETNPYDSFTAYIEDDGRTIYLYMQSEHNPDWKMKSLWIRNCIPAPKERNQEDFELGIAPILTEEEVFHPEGHPPITPDSIQFVWTEEGDGVFLLINGVLEAFLPPWSGLQGFHGYSRYAKENALTASPLGDPNNGVLYDRMVASKKYWEWRAQSNSWKSIQKKRLEYLESLLGPHTKYWSADGGKFPPLAIALFEPVEYPRVKFFVTLGMSAQNQPAVELYHEDYERYARIELVLAFYKPEDSDRSEEWVQHILGDMIKYPWNTGTWFGHGHSIGMNRRDPDELYLNFRVFFLRNLSQSTYPVKSNLPLFTNLYSENGQPVNFLALIPLSEEEKLILQTEGSHKIISALDEKSNGYLHNPERKFLWED